MSIDKSEPHTLGEPERCQEEVVPPLPLGAAPGHVKFVGPARHSPLIGVPQRTVTAGTVRSILARAGYKVQALAVAESQRDKESAKQSARGKRSGIVRRENRKWVKHAEELAKEIRKENPRLSQEDVATDIEARWKLDKIKCKGHPTLVKHIREMEKSGALPRRRVK
jgi:hypothetical protein